jgi:hypothetical protein
MKFMLLYKLHPEKRHDALKGFAQMTPEDDIKDMGNGIKLIGRWHDVAHSRGVAIFEANDAEAIYNWALNWNTVLDLEIAPVLDDAETRAFGNKRFA